MGVDGQGPEPFSQGDRPAGEEPDRTRTHIREQSLKETVVPSDSESEPTFVPTAGALSGEVRRGSDGGTRFRILRPHARGGLGEVFVARDEELNRDVALKEIRGEHADNKDSRGRFLLEAEITGGLEHPGIVPVYGLGQYPDGRPYYAMRFIQGGSLREAISAYHSPQRASVIASERTLQLRQLLGRFVDVCQAVSYAHSRGVLHRDLKPGNIMLGKYGETLVVDWGLAKVQGLAESSIATADQRLKPTSGDGVTPTIMGSALGTPAYMPPEQAAGKLDQLGPASDVYSLGATLYHLLTGKAPFQGDNLTETLKAVQSGTFPRPSEVSANVPKPLEAVCLKAMALKPHDRYASPQDLADDIERYLADEPVQAFPEPFSVRTKRWVRKHPTLITTTAAVVLLTAVGLGTFSSILGAKNSQLSNLNDELGDRNTQLAKANANLDQANDDLTAANLREVEARELAQKNEAAAVEQSQLALSTLTSVMADVQRGLMNLPGGGELRRNLLIASLDGLQHVATEYVEKSVVDHNTLAALNDIGDLIVQFGAGDRDQRSGLGGLLGNRVLSEDESSAIELAKLYYSRARDIARELLLERPDDVAMQRNLSVSCLKLGDVHLQLGEMESALAFHLECITIRERLLDLDPSGAQSRRDLSIACEGLAAVRLRLGDTASALDLYTRSQAIREELAAEIPDDASMLRDLSVVYHNLGQLHLRLEDASAALEFFKESFEIDSRLLPLDPDDTLAQRDLSICYENLGDAHLRLGNFEAARVAFENKLDIDERLREMDPHNVDALRNLSIAYERMGGLCLLDNQAQAALENYEEQFQIAEQLAEQDPTNHEKQMWLSTAYEKLGDASVTLSDMTSALTNYEACQSIRERIAAEVGTSSEWRIALVIACNNLGNLHLKLGNPEQALRLHQQSLDISRACEELAADDIAVQRILSQTLTFLGDSHVVLEEYDAALGYYGEQLQILNCIAEANPTNVQAQRELWIANDRIGLLRLQLGQAEAALEYFKQSLDFHERSAKGEDASAQQVSDLSICYERLGLAHLQLENNEAALDFLQKNVELCERLALLDGENTQAQRYLSVAYDRLARVQLQIGNIQTAIELYEFSLEVAVRLAAENLENAQFQRDSMVAHYMLGKAKVANLDYEAAAEHYGDAVEVIDRMIANNQNVGQSRAERDTLLTELRAVEREAAQMNALLADWPNFIARPEARSLLPQRIVQLASIGRFDEIPQSAEMLRSIDPENPENLYNAGCGYALCANAIPLGEGPELTPEQQAQRQEYIDLALACLRESIAAGFSDFDYLQQDPDLAVLHELPEFEELMLIPAAPPMAE